ncbi:MAG: ABC transporter ATP-binding protein, partial [Acidimicrobiales bacterium]
MDDQRAEAAIEVRGLRKSYDGVERVHAIDFSVAQGEIFGLLGTNGAGKTSTIEILEGYRARDAGEVLVLGADPSHPTRAWRERIGIVLQESELDPLYTVRETVTQFGRYFSDAADVDATIARVGLGAKADERIGRLSGGQKRAVDVALGLIGRPDLLFLDEPTTGLDPAARREMWATIGDLRDAGTTILLTTHYMDEAQYLADRLVILRAGDVVGSGTTAELSAGDGDTAVVTFHLDQPSGLAAVAPEL